MNGGVIHWAGTDGGVEGRRGGNNRSVASHVRCWLGLLVERYRRQLRRPFTKLSKITYKREKLRGA